MASLTTKKLVIDFLKGPYKEADIRDEWLLWVDSMIRRHTGENFSLDSTVVTAEKSDGNGSTTIFLKNHPVVSVEAVRSGEPGVTTLVSASTYSFKPEGMIVLKAGFWLRGVNNIEVDYTHGGMTSIPPYVEAVATEMVALRTKAAKDQGVISTLAKTQTGGKAGTRRKKGRLQGVEAQIQDVMSANLYRKNRIR